MTGIHHFELCAGDLERSYEFWGWLFPKLGFILYQEYSTGKSWKAGDTYVDIRTASPEFSGGRHARGSVGLHHVAFHALSKEEVDRLYHEIKARGMTVLDEAQYPHAGGSEHYALYFEDPNGIKVEIVAPRE